MAREKDSSRSDYEFDQELIRMYSKREKLSIHGFYKVGKIIGDGNFAVVRQCKNRQTGKEYALKVINKAKVKGKEHMIENEILILRRVKHPHIVELVEEFETPKEIFLIMELVSGGDLFDAIVQATRFTERDASHMIRDLASAVHHLHALHIVHRDIKPENLLVVHKPNGTMSLKLADFGLSIEVKSPMFLVCGTPTYVAPEILDESGYGLKVDIWAIGVISYILLCGFPPFRSENNDQEELFDKIMRGDYEYLSPFWDDISHSAKDLINHMLVVDVDKRFTAHQVLEHPWIKGHTAASKNIQRKLSSELTKNFQHRKRLRGVAMAIQTVIALLKYVRRKRSLADASASTCVVGSFSTPLSPKRALALASKIPRVKPSTPRHHIEEIRKCMTAQIKKYNTYSLCSTKAVSRSVSRANSGEYEVAETGRYSVIGNVYRRARREGKLNDPEKRPTLDAQLGRQTVSSQKLSKRSKPILHKHSCSAHYLSYYETPSMVVGETMKNQAKPRRTSRQSSVSTTPTGRIRDERRVTGSSTPRALVQKSSLSVKGVKPSYIPIRSAPSSPKRIAGDPRKHSFSSVYGSVSLPNTPGVECVSMMASFSYSPANSGLMSRFPGGKKNVKVEKVVNEKRGTLSQGRNRIGSGVDSRKTSTSSGVDSRRTSVSSGMVSRQTSTSSGVDSRRTSTSSNVSFSRSSSMKGTPRETPRETLRERRPTNKPTQNPSSLKTGKASKVPPQNTSNVKQSRPNTLDLNTNAKSNVKGQKSTSKDNSKSCSRNSKPDLKDGKRTHKTSKDGDGNISITTKTSKTENIKIRLGKTVNKMVETETSTTVSVIIENDLKVKKAEESKTEVKEPSLGQTLLSKVKRLAEEIESLAKFDDTQKKSADNDTFPSTQDTYNDIRPVSGDPGSLCQSRCENKASNEVPSEEKPASSSHRTTSPVKTVTELCSKEEVIPCADSSGTRKKTSVSSHSRSFEEEELDLEGIDDIVYSNIRGVEDILSPPECNQDIFGPTEYLSLSSKQDKPPT